MPSALAVALVAMMAMSPVSRAQQPDGSSINLPQLSVSKCTKTGGCVWQTDSVVLDWGYHWIHTRDQVPCVSGNSVSSTYCPTQSDCSKNCVITPANYSNAGVYTSGYALTLYQYRQTDGSNAAVSPRVYLLGPDGNYDTPNLLNQEYSFTVDLSAVPCGENAAMYLVQMEKTGWRNPLNQGASQFGAGYCDAQGYSMAYDKGTINNSNPKARSFCQEMDILEGNSKVSTMSPHPCNGNGCQQYGCSLNPYAQGNRGYWPGTIDVKKPITVITQFITNDGTSTGTLTQIVRKYLQDGFLVASSSSGGDVITDSWCNARGGSTKYGGLATMGQALAAGMTQVFSIWNSGSENDALDWLDANDNGPCTPNTYYPSYIKKNFPTTKVTYYGIRWGDIGTTYDQKTRPPPQSPGGYCGMPDWPPDCTAGYTCSGYPRKCLKP